ncbi:Rab3GAP catalytic subunit, conserved domain [Dillenia turbinata]|uniref:Rab3 GTPase-activating protein catalytic subunit n=1 Tax=Dillenia turbinata TaxID=194707 RepID=A0AAN8VL54_9MAGN
MKRSRRGGEGAVKEGSSKSLRKVIEPQSARHVILDAPEASKLLNAVAIALSNCSSPWPAFVPVQDPSRKAYIGVQNIGTIFTRRFEADCIGSQVPVKLVHLEGLYELFVLKFLFVLLAQTCQHLKWQIQMQFLKISSNGTRLETGSDETETVVSRSYSTEGSKRNWPPRGHLYQRMSENGNSWRAIWNEAPAIPAAEQKPLLNPNQERRKGEILHYLQTLQLHLLLEQMVCTTFRASADTLNETVYGGLKQMNTKLGRIYLTIASTLKPLQANGWNSEIIEDLRRLCDVFEHVEKLLTVAASLHRKFLEEPRLSEEFFSDFYNFYLPRMGTSMLAEIINLEFDAEQQPRYEERQLVADMFTPPTAKQPWRKVRIYLAKGPTLCVRRPEEFTHRTVIALLCISQGLYKFTSLSDVEFLAVIVISSHCRV